MLFKSFSWGRQTNNESKRHGMTRGFDLSALLTLHSASILTTVLGQKLLQTRGQSCSKARSLPKHPTDICLTSSGEVKRRVGGVGVQTFDLQLCVGN